MNIAGPLFSASLTQQITVYRQNGAWVAGVWTPGAPTAVSMQAVVTTPSGADLDMIPMGDRERGAIEVFVASPLTLQITQATGTSDQVAWNGDTYRVAKVWDWSQYGYFKAIAVKMTATVEA